jgi:hypothetical protein
LEVGSRWLTFSLRIARTTLPLLIPPAPNHRQILRIHTCQPTPDTRRHLHKRHIHHTHRKPRRSRKAPRQEQHRPSLLITGHHLDKALPVHPPVVHDRYRRHYKLSSIQSSNVYLCWRRLSTRIVKPTFSHLPHASYRLSEQSYLKPIASASNLRSSPNFHCWAKNGKPSLSSYRNWSIVPRRPVVFMRKYRKHLERRKMMIGTWKSSPNQPEQSLLESSDS